METKHNWKLFFIKIILPTILAITLFTVSFFLILIPSLERNLLDQKREMIQQLTNSVWSIVADYSEKFDSGELSLEEAQKLAAKRIEKIRYGEENKDYFWISDINSKMIMHPYRPDLNFKDVSDYSDSYGKKIFVEFSNIVAESENGDGFLSYMWQWEDNPDRIVPKLSYVKIYKKWGWIIGTGIYIEDVKEEIANLTSKIVIISLVIVAILMVVLLHILWQTIAIEKKRFVAESNNIESKEKYKALVEAATDGYIMVLNKVEILSNPTLQSMLGYTEREIANLSIYDIIDSNDSVTSSHIKQLMEGVSVSDQFEARLLSSDKKSKRVLITASLINFSSKNGFMLIVRQIEEDRQFIKVRAEEEREILIDELKATLSFFNEKVEKYSKPLITCDMNSSMDKVSLIMNQKDTGVVFITAAEDEIIGIVTDNDIRSRLVAKGLKKNIPVTQIMSAPIVRISNNTPVFEAALAMQENNVRHLALSDNNGKIIGVINNSDLIQISGYSAVSLISAIDAIKRTDDLSRNVEKISILITSLLNSGGNSKNIARIVSAVSEAVYRKVVELTIYELGNIPCEFALVAFGAEGRQEQALDLVQSNAIVYEDCDLQNPETAEAYFYSLAQKICDVMSSIGYEISYPWFKEPSFIGKESCYVKPFSQWCKELALIIEEDSREDIDIKNIGGLFDIHCLYGSRKILAKMRNNVFENISSNKDFLNVLVESINHHKLPLSMFGNIVTESSGEHQETFDIGQIMEIIADIIRVYSLMNKISEGNTFDRLRVLYNDKKAISSKEYNEIYLMYDYLMQIRLQHQTKTAKNNEDVNNHIDPDVLSEVEKQTLKSIFSQIQAYQSKVTQDVKKL